MTVTLNILSLVLITRTFWIPQAAQAWIHHVQSYRTHPHTHCFRSPSASLLVPRQWPLLQSSLDNGDEDANDNSDSNSNSDNNSNDNQDAWDDNVDYDKIWANLDKDTSDYLPTSEWNEPPNNPTAQDLSLGLPTGLLSQLLDEETASQLQDEAKQIFEQQVQQGLEDLKTLKQTLMKDLQSSQRALQRSSQARLQREETKLLQKIDAMTNTFLKDSQLIRDTTKRAAAADAAQIGQGVELGSWGTLANGAAVTLATTTSTTARENTETGNAVGVLLGSVENAKQQQQRIQLEDVAAPPENRILMIADESSDPYAKQLVPALIKAFQEILPIQMEIIKPTQQIPLGGNNAVTVILFLTSLSSSPRPILERLLRRTMGPSGTMGRPPTQLVAISTIGTERTDKFPYNMQNLLGRKLDNRRDMEECIVSLVRERAVSPPLDYTILKFGELKDDSSSSSTANDFAFLPGDVLDGTTSVDLAIETLIQAMAFQPSARNATLCTTGHLPPKMTSLTSRNCDNQPSPDPQDKYVEQDKDDYDETMYFWQWDDVFLKLEGPELMRWESSRDIAPSKFVSLVEYLREWGKVLAEGNVLTTPVDFILPSSTETTIQRNGWVQQRDGLKLLFRPTNTGQNYLSKQEERDLENKGFKLPNSPKTTTRSGKLEGGVQVWVEVVQSGTVRVRATRTNMGPDTVVKELSERLILNRLKETLDFFVRDFVEQ